MRKNGSRLTDWALIEIADVYEGMGILKKWIERSRIDAMPNGPDKWWLQNAVKTNG